MAASNALSAWSCMAACAGSSSLIWVHGRLRERNWPGDMMADGAYPGDVVRLLVLSGTTTEAGDDRSIAGASRDIS
jgi:hypothetical protein